MTYNLSLIGESRSLMYYIIFLAFPFKTQTDEEDYIPDVIEGLDYEGRVAASVESGVDEIGRAHV